MEAVIFTGIQATGKSTFYTERFFRTHVRINLDMLKTRHRERILLEACIAAKQPFVVDNCNTSTEQRARYVVPAKAAGFRVVGYYFRSRLEDALRRNAARPGRESIPEKGVVAAYARLQVPSRDEGFDALYYVSIDSEGRFVIEAWADEV
jgi:predicted kinase